MLKKPKNEGRYCIWIHLENGQCMTRRLHRIEVQAADGRLYVFEGETLPIAFMTNTGVGHVGHHLGQILLDPKPLNGKEWDMAGIVNKAPKPDKPWPVGRDLVHFLAGSLTLHLIHAVQYAVNETMKY